VEYKFHEDMAVFGNGLIPFIVYHGGLKKCVPVFVRRFACLTDKVERADYTSTLNCTSNYHRLFCTLLAFEIPKDNSTNRASHANYTKFRLAGDCDTTLKQYGWSLNGNLVDHQDTTVGGLLPACYACRKNNVDWLKAPTHPRVIVRCDVCANWAVNSVTKQILKFPTHSGYPTVEKCLPDCPVLPPSGREAGLKHLFYMELDFDGMKQASRYAFFHLMSPKKGKGWTAKMGQEYLRACGVNATQQKLIYDAAKDAGKGGTAIDWDSNVGVGSYRFPASWVGDIPIFLCIEMLMHLLFLGIAASNFDLCATYLTAHKQWDTFKKSAHSLLQILNKFNLSWLLTYPFSGTKRTTGTWVSENWLAWVRISKICYAFCVQEGVTDERKGGNDLLRMVTSFTALVSRVLSHAGSTDRSTDVLDAVVKEFLSSVREFHVLTTGGKENQYWNKSNYVSLLNLAPTIKRLGPLINYWDGGGKGERYIQEIKPHISRGIRDSTNFFVRIMERVYKFDCISLVEKSMNAVVGPETQPDIIIPDDITNDEDDGSAVSDVSFQSFEMNMDGNLEGDEETTTSEELAEEVMVDNTAATSEEEDDEETTTSEELASEEKEEDWTNTSVLDKEEVKEEEWTTPMESEQMAKARTFYVYKTFEILQSAMDNLEPISGIVVGKEDSLLEMLVVYRTAGNLAWKKINFSDDSGIYIFGMWYALISMSETEIPPPTSMGQLVKETHMSTMAIPLRYGVSRKHMTAAHSKYCVITNWWRERNCEGKYVLPTLAFDYYADKQTNTTSL
jgi:hypothetical protein